MCLCFESTLSRLDINKFSSMDHWTKLDFSWIRNEKEKKNWPMGQLGNEQWFGLFNAMEFHVQYDIMVLLVTKIDLNEHHFVLFISIPFRFAHKFHDGFYLQNTRRDESKRNEAKKK